MTEKIIKKSFVVYEEDKGKRLDVFLLKNLKDWTRSHIKNLNENKKILVNQKFVKSGYMLKTSDKIDLEIPPLETISIKPEEIKIDIVYEDEDLAVINKPQNMVVHPAQSCKNGTLVNALLFNIKNLSGINGKIRPGIVHRLDKDTSGLIVVAKNDFAHLSLQKQIQNKTCHRFYKAVVYGKFTQDEGIIETGLEHSKKNYKKIVVVSLGQGKVAKTLYKVLNYSNGFSFVEYELKTGRTHQIRVHSAFINHPVVGDKLYGRKPEKFDLVGQLLHAYKIEFVQPKSLRKMSFEVPLPDYFSNFLKNHF